MLDVTTIYFEISKCSIDVQVLFKEAMHVFDINCLFFFVLLV